MGQDGYREEARRGCLWGGLCFLQPGWTCSSPPPPSNPPWFFSSRGGRDIRNPRKEKPGPPNVSLRSAGDGIWGRRSGGVGEKEGGGPPKHGEGDLGRGIREGTGGAEEAGGQKGNTACKGKLGSDAAWRRKRGATCLSIEGFNEGIESQLGVHSVIPLCMPAPPPISPLPRSSPLPLRSSPCMNGLRSQPFTLGYGALSDRRYVEHCETSDCHDASSTGNYPIATAPSSCTMDSAFQIDGASDGEVYHCLVLSQLTRAHQFGEPGLFSAPKLTNLHCTPSMLT